MHIIGTAGHVDHGKSSLVRALTGTNPDRWLEEQLRGMTLDLGFAHLQFDDGTQAGIVDVPGHERFLHNMLAGAAGMELLLLVIAANEGVMPQTLEHLQILQYLNVRDSIVVVTKTDLIGPEEEGEVCRRIRERLAGTISADAPIHPVSTLTGANLDALREAIRTSLQALPPRNPDAPAYLPVDRVFALPGHGTIVTGTLMQGRIARGDTLTLQPSGKTVRVRSLQSFGQPIAQVQGGARVAVNVPSVDKHAIARGEMLVASQFTAHDVFAVSFTPLPQACGLLRRRNAVRAYIGSAEILGTLVFEDQPLQAAPLHAQLFLRRPTVAYPGAAFVLRRLSPKTLLGGGSIDCALAQTQAPGQEELPHERAVLALLRKEPPAALSESEIARGANVREEAVRETLEVLLERGEVLRVLRPTAYVDAEKANSIAAAVLDVLAGVHRTEPWALGATSLMLARTLAVDEALLVRLLAAFAHEGRIAMRAGYFSAPDHTPELSVEQQRFFAEAVPKHDPGNFVPVSLADVVSAVKHSRIPGISKAFDTLIATGALVKVNDELYRGSQIAAIHARVESFLRTNGRMTMAQFRDLIGTSRKYAVPLLEWFDSRAVTVRSEDYRMLRSRLPADR